MFQALRRVHVAASDFARSRRFYGETLGLQEIGSFEIDWVEYGLGPIILKLTRLRSGEVPARNQVAAIFSTNSLDSTLTTLKERGVTVTRPPQEEFTGRSAEILDPDGYRILVFQASDLHPDEEWVPMSRVDEAVKLKLAAKRQKEKARTSPKAAPKAKASKPSARKSAAKAPKAAKKPASRAARKPAPKKTKSGAKKPARKPAKKTAKKSGKKR